MMTPRAPLASAALVVALLAGPALAAEPEVDGVIATRPGAPPALTTDQKIANILAASRAEDADSDVHEVAGPRQVHGEAGVSVGTGGYRAGYVSALIPVGESGTVGIAYSQAQGGRGFGYGRGPGFGGPGMMRGGQSQALGLSFDYRDSKKADACAPAFYDGSRPVEPVWATEARGRSACAPTRD